MKPETTSLAAAAIAGFSLLAGSSHAELVLLEQFDYEGTDVPLLSQDGGTGFAGAWQASGWSQDYVSGRTIFAPNPGVTGNTVNAVGGLEFSDHPTAGSALSRYGTAGQRQVNRPVSQTSLITDDTTIWFSLLISAPNNNRFGTIIFGTDPMVAVQGSTENGNLSVAGQGFGVTLTADGGGGGTGSPNAVAFVDSTIKTIANGSFTPNLEVGGTHHDVTFVVGKINWKANGTADELFLFNMAETGLPEPAEVDAVATLTADFDQSNFDTIALWDTGATIFDEIRFGTTFDDVAPGAAPIAPFLITEIVYSHETSMLTLTWASNSDDSYIAKYSTDLINWGGDMGDGLTMEKDDLVTDDGDFLTVTFNLATFELENFENLFFRIEKE